MKFKPTWTVTWAWARPISNKNSNAGKRNVLIVMVRVECAPKIRPRQGDGDRGAPVPGRSNGIRQTNVKNEGVSIHPVAVSEDGHPPANEN